MSYRRNSYKKLKKILRTYGEEEVILMGDARRKRLIFWALHIPKGN